MWFFQFSFVLFTLGGLSLESVVRHSFFKYVHFVVFSSWWSAIHFPLPNIYLEPLF